MKDTSVIEWYKDGEKIDPYDLHTPTVINPEYDDGTMSVAVDESTNGQPRYILHHNNSITIENVEDADVGSYTCKVDTGIGEPLGTYQQCSIHRNITSILNNRYVLFLNYLFLFLCYSFGSRNIIYKRFMVVDCHRSINHNRGSVTIHLLGYEICSKPPKVG